MTKENAKIVLSNINLGTTLDEERRQKAQLVGRIIDNYLKTHVIAENEYGALFDKFDDQDFRFLLILNEINKII